MQPIPSIKRKRKPHRSETTYRIRSIKRTVRLCFSNLHLKCPIELHTNKHTLKTKVTFRKDLLWKCLLSGETFDAVLGWVNAKINLNHYT